MKEIEVIKDFKGIEDIEVIKATKVIKSVM